MKHLYKGHIETSNFFLNREVSSSQRLKLPYSRKLSRKGEIVNFVDPWPMNGAHAHASTDLFGRLQLDRFCLASRSVLGSNTHDPYAVPVVSLLVVYAHVQTGMCLSKNFHECSQIRESFLPRKFPAIRYTESIGKSSFGARKVVLYIEFFCIVSFLGGT